MSIGSIPPRSPDDYQKQANLDSRYAAAHACARRGEAFAIAVRLRTSAAKRFKRVENVTALIWKLLLVVEQHFRKLNAPHLCAEVYAGVEYRDGERVLTSKSSTRAREPDAA